MTKDELEKAIADEGKKLTAIGMRLVALSEQSGPKTREKLIAAKNKLGNVWWNELWEAYVEAGVEE